MVVALKKTLFFLLLNIPTLMVFGLLGVESGFVHGMANIQRVAPKKTHDQTISILMSDMKQRSSSLALEIS